MERFFVGTEAECNDVRDAMNLVMGLPSPPTGSGLSAQQKTDMVAAWYALLPEQRTDAAMAALLPGWTVQYSMLFREWPPAPRCACVVPSDLSDLLTAAATAGRTLSLAQTTAVTAALASSSTALPANWETEPEP